MKLAICSDVHGAKRNVNALLGDMPKVDALCFLGDLDKDAEYLDYGLRECQPSAAFYAVAGNNDPFSARAKSIVLCEMGQKVLITHGHLYRNIRSTRLPMAHQMAALQVTLALYGHTHQQADETLCGVRLVNPGALMDRRWALITLEGDEVIVQMQTLILHAT